MSTLTDFQIGERVVHVGYRNARAMGGHTGRIYAVDVYGPTVVWDDPEAPAGRRRKYTAAWAKKAFRRLP